MAFVYSKVTLSSFFSMILGVHNPPDATITLTSVYKVMGNAGQDATPIKRFPVTAYRTPSHRNRRQSRGWVVLETTLSGAAAVMNHVWDKKTLTLYTRLLTVSTLANHHCSGFVISD